MGASQKVWASPGPSGTPHPGLGFPINNVGNDRVRNVGNDKRDQAGMTALEHPSPKPPHPGPLPQGERESVGPRLTRHPHGIGPVSGPAHLVTSTGPSCHSRLPSCHSRLLSCHARLLSCHARRPHLSFPQVFSGNPGSFLFCSVVEASQEGRASPAPSGTPHPDPLPQGEREADNRAQCLGANGVAVVGGTSRE